LARKPVAGTPLKGAVAAPLHTNDAVAASASAQAVVLPPTHQSFDLELPLRDARDQFERAYFEYHLGQENGSMTRVAEKTGLERTHLYRKLKQLGVDLSKTKRAA
jgi:DNA-binding NtrC family response regulator